MSIFESIGMAWVIFTSSLATIGFFYCAWTGLKAMWEAKERGEMADDMPVRRVAR